MDADISIAFAFGQPNDRRLDRVDVVLRKQIHFVFADQEIGWEKLVYVIVEFNRDDRRWNGRR